MASHPDWSELEALMPAVRKLQELASKHGIDDIFQDNGGKILQMLLALNLQGIPGREGNDAVDSEGHEYELKSVNIWLTAGFSTNHHVNAAIIKKYREVRWVFAMYEGIDLRRAYAMTPEQLEPYFSQWEAKWHATGKDINNPKIPLKFVIDHGELVYTDQLQLDLEKASVVRSTRAAAAKNRREARAKAQAILVESLAEDDEPPADPEPRDSA